MPTRRGRDLKILYDQDRGGQRTVVQRTYKDAQDVQLTPVTPALLARVQTGVPVERSALIPRKTLCCLPNPTNASGESNMQVIIPYVPASAEQENHLNELVNYDNGKYEVAAIQYFSEGLN